MRISQKSFSGGEISPALYKRNDLQKYATSLKTLKNGFVLQEGSVLNRSGFEFVAETKNSQNVRLIPFSFNTEQTYIIELGDKYARFIKDGAQIIYPKSDGITSKYLYMTTHRNIKPTVFYCTEILLTDENITVYIRGSYSTNNIHECNNEYCYKDVACTEAYGKIIYIPL